jgi:hypothetical protein
MMQREQQNAGTHPNPFRFHSDQSRHQKRVGDIAVGLLMMLRDVAAVPAAGLGHLGFGDNLIDDSPHVPTGGRIL